jgi:hypothetical protein
MASNFVSAIIVCLRRPNNMVEKISLYQLLLLPRVGWKGWIKGRFLKCTNVKEALLIFTKDWEALVEMVILEES